MLYTIGHSNHDLKTFIDLLTLHSITAIADVRSHPYSKYASQYSLPNIKPTLTNSGVTYVFLGKELGARSENPNCYVDNKIQYNRLAKEPSFLNGLQRILRGMDQYRIALMCSEKDPIVCHRALLISRILSNKGVGVNHIHTNGSLEPHTEMEDRLLVLHKLPKGNMFKSKQEFVEEAYNNQSQKVAYVKTK